MVRIELINGWREAPDLWYYHIRHFIPKVRPYTREVTTLSWFGVSLFVFWKYQKPDS